MGLDCPVALALGSIPLGRIDPCSGSVGRCSRGRYTGPVASCSGGWRSPVKFQDCRGEEHCMATLIAPLGSASWASCLYLKAGERRSTAKFAASQFVSASADGAKRRVPGGSEAVATVVRHGGISALCSSTGLDVARKNPGQLPRAENGPFSERCGRRIGPPVRRAMGGRAVATADTDQTLPGRNGGGEKAPPTRSHRKVSCSGLKQKRSVVARATKQEQETEQEKPKADVEETTRKLGLEAGLWQIFTSKEKDKEGAPVSRTTQAKDLLTRYGGAYLATSITLSLFSFGLCYVLVSNGVDVTSLLEKVGISTNETGEKVGTFALAYAAHKAASPIRFPPTVALTPIVAGWFGKKPVEVVEEEKKP